MTTEWTKPAAILAMVVGLVGWRSGSVWGGGASAGGLLDVDYGALVSRADLAYDRPVSRGEEGMPLGNGRMGSLVWTAPTALRLQINRVDVFGSNCATNSFPERNTDYCGAARGWISSSPATATIPSPRIGPRNTCPATMVW